MFIRKSPPDHPEQELPRATVISDFDVHLRENSPSARDRNVLKSDRPILPFAQLKQSKSETLLKTFKEKDNNTEYLTAKVSIHPVCDGHFTIHHPARKAPF
jgi:hypothetical protein